MTKIQTKIIPKTNRKYRIQSNGEVQSRQYGDWRTLKGRKINKSGHLSVVIRVDGRKREYYIHRLVLEAFIGPCPEGMECRHYPNRDPTDNRLENLMWSDHADNMKDTIKHKTSPRGKRNGNYKTGKYCRTLSHS